MVVALGPGKFYGSSLPRPRIYTDVRFNDERVDPPAPVSDPLMSWAEEAHWSMGGLSFKRHRLQGRIEGSVEKLRAEQEKLFKIAPNAESKKKGGAASPSTPAAPVAVKRKRRLLALLDEEEEEQEEEKQRMVEKKREFRKTARKLGDDFDRVANEKSRSPAPARGGVGKAVLAAVRKQSPRNEEEIEGGIGIKEKSDNNKQTGEKILKKKGEKAVKGTRTSPRLAMTQ